MERQRYADKRLGIVCPVANEEQTIEAFIEEVLAVCGSFHFARLQFFVILDHASTDNTLAIARALDAAQGPVRLVWAPENRSVADAYRRGYREAILADCDWILEIDAGFSHQPRDIAGFLEQMAAGRDCVFGSRFAGGGYFERSAVKRRLLSKGGTVLANLLLGTKLTDMTGGFQCFTRKTLQEILAAGIHSRGPFFQTEIRFHAHRFDYAEVPIRYLNPSHRVKKEAVMEALRQLWRLYKTRRKGGR